MYMCMHGYAYMCILYVDMPQFAITAESSSVGNKARGEGGNEDEQVGEEQPESESVGLDPIPAL